MSIDWETGKSDFFFNSRFPQKTQESFCQKISNFSELKGHLFVATSGTTKLPKWVALSKNAFLVSAKSVNNFLNSTHKDRWINPLPIHHVGSLSIYARAYLSNAKVIPLKDKWNPIQFRDFVEQKEGTLVSLVPTQLFDLIQNNLSAPKLLRAAIIGGGALSAALNKKAISLGWPLVPSYGLTECASQVASMPLNSSALNLLPHIEAKVNTEGLLMIKSDALLTGYIFPDESKFYDPKIDGWFTTEDLVDISGNTIFIKGRKDDIFKIAGEKSSLKQLNEILSEVCLEFHEPIDAALFIKKDERLGHSIELLLANRHAKYADSIIRSFLEKVLPFEKIRTIQFVDAIPRTELGKVSYRG